jgi:4-hydroxy-tetrahydrodipicolinate synthase
VETSTLERLAEHVNIVAVKEASGNLEQMKSVIASTPDDFSVLSGDDSMACDLIAAGGHGVISVLSNLLPERTKAMIDAALAQDPIAQKMHDELLPIMNGCFLETNPIPVKTALAEKGILQEIFRLPMCGMESSNREKWIQILQHNNILS